MAVLSAETIQTLESLTRDQRIHFLMDLAASTSNPEVARQTVETLFAHPLFDPNLFEDFDRNAQSFGAGAWLRHDWMLLAAQRGHHVWANTMLDQGADPNLTTPDGLWGGGQALREVLDIPNYDPDLLERLWRATDLAKMIPIVEHRVQRSQLSGFGLARYGHHADCVAVRHLTHPDPTLDEAVAHLIAVTGEANMPLYRAAKAA